MEVLFPPLPFPLFLVHIPKLVGALVSHHRYAGNFEQENGKLVILELNENKDCNYISIPRFLLYYRSFSPDFNDLGMCIYGYYFDRELFLLNII